MSSSNTSFRNKPVRNELRRCRTSLHDAQLVALFFAEDQLHMSASNDVGVVNRRGLICSHERITKDLKGKLSTCWSTRPPEENSVIAERFPPLHPWVGVGATGCGSTAPARDQTRPTGRVGSIYAWILGSVVKCGRPAFPNISRALDGCWVWNRIASRVEERDMCKATAGVDVSKAHLDIHLDGRTGGSATTGTASGPSPNGLGKGASTGSWSRPPGVIAGRAGAVSAAQGQPATRAD